MVKSSYFVDDLKSSCETLGDADLLSVLSFAIKRLETLRLKNVLQKKSEGLFS